MVLRVNDENTCEMMRTPYKNPMSQRQRGRKRAVVYMYTQRLSLTECRAMCARHVMMIERPVPSATLLPQPLKRQERQREGRFQPEHRIIAQVTAVPLGRHRKAKASTRMQNQMSPLRRARSPAVHSLHSAHRRYAAANAALLLPGRARAGRAGAGGAGRSGAGRAQRTAKAAGDAASRATGRRRR